MSSIETVRTAHVEINSNNNQFDLIIDDENLSPNFQAENYGTQITNIFTTNDVNIAPLPVFDEHQTINVPCQCGSLSHRRTNHCSCPLNKKQNRNAFYFMARPNYYDINNIVGKGIERNPLSLHYGRHLLREQKLTCRNCNAIMFYEEKTKGTDENPIFSLCCSSQRFKLPPISPLPPLLRKLIDPSTILGQHFIKNIRRYNSMFAFTSFNAQVKLIFF